MTSWIEIDEARLQANFAVLQKAAGEAAMLAVVKANAYGHGLVRCARVLALAGAEWLGVTGVEEGAVVRRALADAGITLEAQPRVLVMCGISEEDAEAVVREELTPVVWSVEQVVWLAAAVNRLGRGRTLPVHLEVDSGMTRQGALPGAGLEAVAAAMVAANGLRLDGVMTHIADAEVADSRQTAEQRRVFEAAIAQVRQQDLVLPEWLGVGNTSGVELKDDAEDLTLWLGRLALKFRARSMVRPGLGLYGYSLGLEGKGESRLAGELKPVMTWKAKVIGVKEVPAGAAVGYNGTFVAARPMRLALVAAGYADGLRRELSSTNTKSGGWVMVRGERAAVVGRISMNLTSVDVTGIEGVCVGDAAVLLGEGITAEDHARLAGTIPYEILCGVRAVEREGDFDETLSVLSQKSVA